MDIRINSNTNFQSKANPIKPFVIRTKQGRFKVCEASRKDLNREDFFINLAKFFCKNFASSTKDPNLKIFKNSKNADYEKTLEDLAEYYKAKVLHNDDNMTLLLVKNKRNKIQGACLSYGCDILPTTKKTTCYIDSIAVAPACRGFKIGKFLLQKTLESAKHTFSDAFLAGDKEAAGFYHALGFDKLNKNNKDQKFIMDYISIRRTDYPKYIELYTKPLQETKERWYKNIREKIKSELEIIL